MSDDDRIVAAVRRWASWADLEVDEEAITEMVDHVRDAHGDAPPQGWLREERRGSAVAD